MIYINDSVSTLIVSTAISVHSHKQFNLVVSCLVNELVNDDIAAHSGNCRDNTHCFAVALTTEAMLKCQSLNLMSVSVDLMLCCINNSVSLHYSLTNNVRSLSQVLTTLSNALKLNKSIYANTIIMLHLGICHIRHIVIYNSYAQPADLNTAVSSGAVQLAVLPEPMVTIARSANDKLTAALDLTAEWDKVAPAGSLVQGCAVVRREFAEAHPAELACFLNEYKASVEALTADVQGSAEKIQETGIFAKAAVAAKAIPNYNICFIDGADMQSALAAFYEVMYSVALDSIGGSIPGDDFYCVLG